MNLALNPEDGDDPAYGQIFIVDTEHAMRAMRHANAGIDPQLLRTAYEVIRNVNPFAEAYVMMKEEENDEAERARNENREPAVIKLLFETGRQLNRRLGYNVPRENEVAAVYVPGADVLAGTLDLSPNVHPNGQNVLQTRRKGGNVQFNLLDPNGFRIFNKSKRKQRELRTEKQMLKRRKLSGRKPFWQNTSICQNFCDLANGKSQLLRLKTTDKRNWSCPITFRSPSASESTVCRDCFKLSPAFGVANWTCKIASARSNLHTNSIVAGVFERGTLQSATAQRDRPFLYRRIGGHSGIVTGAVVVAKALGFSLIADQSPQNRVDYFEGEVMEVRVNSANGLTVSALAPPWDLLWTCNYFSSKLINDGQNSRLDRLLSDNGDSSRTDQLWSFAEFLSPEPGEQNAESVSLFSNLVEVPGISARRNEICRMAWKLNPQCPQTDEWGKFRPEYRRIVTGK
ncbi:hypothetical protein niasHT_029209 [Heterodera trifolii]|uniref:Uncharacterized protein n=1 Tax=Heterodera trifolii TaxID=157864 RepID=A0ABD2K0I3_9BILA